LQRNEGTAAPAAFSLASVPGTIPATVRPPRIPELAGYNGGVTTASTPAPAPVPARAASPAPVRVASAAPETPQQPPQGGVNAGNLFGSLFSSSPKSADAKTEKKDDGPLDRVARFMGLRGSDPAPATEPASAPKPRPAAKPAHQPAPGAIRPAPVVAAAAAPAPAPTPAPVRTAETQPVLTVAPSNTISGAAQALPAGSFESRWSAFR
jgi:hypothetical protein